MALATSEVIDLTVPSPEPIVISSAESSPATQTNRKPRSPSKKFNEQNLRPGSSSEIDRNHSRKRVSSERTVDRISDEDVIEIQVNGGMRRHGQGSPPGRSSS